LTGLPRLRLATREDDAFLAALYLDHRAAEFAPTGLPPDQIEALVAEQWRMQCTSHLAAYPGADRMIIMVNGEAVGQTLLDRTRSPWHLIDLLIVSACRGMGHGQRVIAAMQQICCEQGCDLALNVECESPARHVYDRMKFEPTGKNDGFRMEMVWRADQGRFMA
jgi:GNAT superfamily N-acetyltransferase